MGHPAPSARRSCQHAHRICYRTHRLGGWNHWLAVSIPSSAGRWTDRWIDIAGHLLRVAVAVTAATFTQAQRLSARHSLSRLQGAAWRTPVATGHGEPLGPAIAHPCPLLPRDPYCPLRQRTFGWEER